MKKSVTLLAATVVTMATTGTNAATVLTFTEGVREQVADTTPIDGSLTNIFPGYNLSSSLNPGDSIELYGTIGAAQDFFSFTSTAPVKIEWIFGGYSLDNGDSIADSGFVAVTGSNTSTFDITSNATALSETFVTGITSGIETIFTLGAAGAYVLKIDGSGDRALYDIRISAIPLPAAAWLFGSVLLGAGALRYRRRRTG